MCRAERGARHVAPCPTGTKRSCRVQPERQPDHRHRARDGHLANERGVPRPPERLAQHASRAPQQPVRLQVGTHRPGPARGTSRPPLLDRAGHLADLQQIPGPRTRTISLEGALAVCGGHRVCRFGCLATCGGVFSAGQFPWLADLRSCRDACPPPQVVGFRRLGALPRSGRRAAAALGFRSLAADGHRHARYSVVVWLRPARVVARTEGPKSRSDTGAWRQAPIDALKTLGSVSRMACIADRGIEPRMPGVMPAGHGCKGGPGRASDRVLLADVDPCIGRGSGTDLGEARLEPLTPAMQRRLDVVDLADRCRRLASESKTLLFFASVCWFLPSVSMTSC